jgi:pyruvate kinase
MEPKAIVTIPPYAPFIDEVLRHEIVSGIRLNTVMPVKDSLEDVLKRLDEKARRYSKELWVDLKCRQLRVKSYGVPPFTEIELTHNIQVNTPVTAYFSDGKEVATVLAVEGNKLIMQEGPKRVVGPGESVNIPHHSLAVDGYFTDTDKRYIEAGNKIGMHNYMISFVEGQEDIEALYKLDPQAVPIAKIESRKGMDYVAGDWDGKTRLMAARGDLFVELRLPHHIIGALETIVQKDPNAVVASRIFNSLAYSPEPSCEDIADADNLLRMGYRTLMLGDDVCMRHDSVISSLNLLDALAGKYRADNSKVLIVKKSVLVDGGSK